MAPVSRLAPGVLVLAAGVVACRAADSRRLEVIAVPAPSLAGSVIPNASEQPAIVVLPPGYHESTRDYPVVYYLPGFTTDASEYIDASIDGFRLDATLHELVGRGAIQELVVVIVSGRNALGGSFYVSSPVTGRWEDHVLADVIPFVEARYRVRRSAAQRGIAGDSMGGFGALHLAMRHPDVFGAVFAISPGLFDDRGLEDQGMLGEHMVAAWLLQERRMRGWPAAEAPRRLIAFQDELFAADRFAYRRAFALAYGAAFAPRPEGGPPYVRFPVRLDGGREVTDPEAVALFRRGFGDLAAKVHDHLPAWRALRGIGLDVGRDDHLAWIPRGTRRLSALLSASGIPHQLTEHDGGHVDRLGERVASVMLPFFSRVFAAGERP